MSLYMNTNIKIVVTIFLVALALFGAYQFGKSVSLPASPSSTASSTDATATTTATSTGVTTSPKPSSPKPVVQSAKPSSSNTLVKIDYRGGVCLNGKMCATTKVITKDAVYYKDGVKVSNINKNDVFRLSTEMERTDWTALKSKPKTTGCDLQRVQEIVYTFYTSKGIQVISNCQHDFDVTQPPFRIIGVLLPQ